MKKYDRKTKKWVEEETIKHTRKKDTCRGQKAHDFVLVLPPYVTYEGTYKHNPEEYYVLLEEGKKVEFELSKKIAALGVVERFTRAWSLMPVMRHYVCSVCKKQELGKPVEIG